MEFEIVVSRQKSPSQILHEWFCSSVSKHQKKWDIVCGPIPFDFYVVFQQITFYYQSVLQVTVQLLQISCSVFASSSSCNNVTAIHSQESADFNSQTV